MNNMVLHIIVERYSICAINWLPEQECTALIKTTSHQVGRSSICKLILISFNECEVVWTHSAVFKISNPR